MLGQFLEHSPPLLLTTSWDDGHPLDMRIADLLQKYGLRGTFYVPTQPATARLSAAQIRWLGEEFEVAAHTVHHVWLTAISDVEVRRELAEGKDRLEQLTGKPCRAFCFPGGRYAHRHLGMLRECGYEVARTVELMSVAWPHTGDGIMVMPTTVQAYDHTAVRLFRNGARNHRPAAFFHWARCCRSSDWVVVGRTLLRQAAKRGGVFHLWGHSWEIEHNHDWERLEQMLAAISEQCGRRLTNGEVCFGRE